MLLTVLAYSRVAGLGFLTLDDPDYVTQNPNVRAGVSVANLVWATTTTAASNWHPLTWISLMLDSSLGGLDPHVFHLTSLFLHMTAAVLLFLSLWTMTGMQGRSWFVTALFAVHPLHVESVAWIAERKDVLSGAFWFLTLLAYAWYVARPGARRLAVVVAIYAAGLMAKPMLVSLPIVLLAIDYWPLGRLRGTDEQPLDSRAVSASSGRGAEKRRKLDAGGTSGMRPSKGARFRSLVLEKWPLFSLAAVSCAVTLLAQRGAVATLETFPLSVRVTNAVVAYVRYGLAMFWPLRLAIYYPHPGGIPPLLQVLGSLLLLGVVSVMAVRWRRRFPFLLVGWVWYLVTLVPVIGVVQVGHQAMADRYTYIPLVGLFIVVSWGLRAIVVGAAEAVKGTGRAGASHPEETLVNGSSRASGRDIPAVWDAAMGTAAVLLCLILAGATRRQLGFWKDSITLFERTIAVTPPNSLAHNSLAAALIAQNRFVEAASHYYEAYRIGGYQGNHFNAAAALASAGRSREAEALAREEERLWPGHVRTHISLGLAAAVGGDAPNAIRHFEDALRLDPNNVDAHLNLGLVYLNQGRLDEATAELTTVLRINPEDRATRRTLDEIRRRRMEPR